MQAALPATDTSGNIANLREKHVSTATEKHLRGNGSIGEPMLGSCGWGRGLLSLRSSVGNIASSGRINRSPTRTSIGLSQESEHHHPVPTLQQTEQQQPVATPAGPMSGRFLRKFSLPVFEIAPYTTLASRGSMIRRNPTNRFFECVGPRSCACVQWYTS